MWWLLLDFKTEWLDKWGDWGDPPTLLSHHLHYALPCLSCWCNFPVPKCLRDRYFSIDITPPQKKITCHLKRDHFKRNGLSSNLHFSEGYISFRGVWFGSKDTGVTCSVNSFETSRHSEFLRQKPVIGWMGIRYLLYKEFTGRCPMAGAWDVYRLLVWWYL